ncbi:MAG: glycosyltransferase [Steroidobacteraceae bacterium]
MNLIDVSVIIPTCRREREVLQAIDSALSQRDIALEVIVIDDSAEGSARGAVSAIDDRRVRYICRSEPSRGRPALARNDGAALAQGRYLYFLDDDDMLEPDVLACLAQALDAAPGAGMAFGAVMPFGSDEAVLSQQLAYFTQARRIAGKLKGRHQLSAYLTFRNAVLVCSAGMARRTAFIEVGGFDAEIPVCEDADLWARIANTRGHVFIDRPVVRYRTGASSLMHNLAANDEKLHLSYRRIQQKYRQANGLPRFLASKLWARFALR